MKYFNIFLFLLVFSSCKRTYKEYYLNGKLESEYELRDGKITGKGIYYNEDGTIKRILYFKNDIRDSVSNEFYKDGKVRIKGYYILGNKDGWWTTFDSATSKVIEETYYNNNNKYITVKSDKDGNCKYYWMRPRILKDRDTLFVNSNDSIPFTFVEPKKLNLNIKNYLIRVTSLDDNLDYGMYFIIVYPAKHYFIYIKDIENYFKHKNVLFSIDVQAIATENVRLCNCDSIESAETHKYIYINR